MVQGAAFSRPHQRAARQDDLDAEIARGMRAGALDDQCEALRGVADGMRLGGRTIARSSIASHWDRDADVVIAHAFERQHNAEADGTGAGDQHWAASSAARCG